MSDLSEERFDHEEPKDEDVEAHKHRVARKVAENEEPDTEESDDVEAHMRRAQHKNL